MSSSTVMMERSGVGVAGVGYPGVGTGTVPGATGVPTAGNWLMVPRCTYRVEKCTGGLKITCSCDDQVACGMVQNLCAMLAGGLCTCCVQYNGMTVLTCNLTQGLCRCEPTQDGVCVTCTTGDTACGQMLQSFCDCLNSMLEAGCTCCVMMNGTPVCCGYSQSQSKTGGTGKQQTTQKGSR